MCQLLPMWKEGNVSVQHGIYGWRALPRALWARGSGHALSSKQRVSHILALLLASLSCQLVA